MDIDDYSKFLNSISKKLKNVDVKIRDLYQKFEILEYEELCPLLCDSIFTGFNVKHLYQMFRGGYEFEDYTKYMMNPASFDIYLVKEEDESFVTLDFQNEHFNFKFYVLSFKYGHRYEEENLKYQFYSHGFKYLDMSGKYNSEFSNFEELLEDGFSYKGSIIILLIFNYLRDFLY